jgi:hypothetical protein
MLSSASAVGSAGAIYVGALAETGPVFRIARGTSTTRAVKGTARNSIRGYQ